MKKTGGSIKIDFIRRPDLPPVPAEDQLRSKIYKNKSEQGLHHEQVLINNKKIFSSL